MTRRVLLLLSLATAIAACAAGEASEPEAGVIDLTSAMTLQSAAGCRFDARTNHAIDGLLMLEDYDPSDMVSAREVFIGELRLTPRIEREPHGRAEYGGAIYTSRAPFPAGSRWNGLTPTAIYSYYVHNAESDHYEERGITFADSPEKVRATLLALGQDVPISPDHLELTDHGPFFGAGCGAAIEIRPEESGAVIACGYGC